MSAGLRARVALTAIAATAAALLSVLLLAAPGFRRIAMDRARATLLDEARLFSRTVEEPLARRADPGEVDALVDATAKGIGARLTVIALDGKVLGDSSESGGDLAAMDNHAGRPEVSEAVASGTGTSVRHSATVKEDLLYAAVAVRHDGRLVGVARVARSLASVEAQAAELRRGVVVALLIAFVLIAVVSALLSAPLAGPLDEIMDAARQFAAGNLAARIRARRDDEFGELARILNHSADQLQARLTESTRERARTEAILSAMDDGVLAVNHVGVVLVANDTLRRHLGLEDPVGRHYVEVIRQREVGEVLEDVLRTGERRAVEVELMHVRRDFSLIAVSFPGAEGMPHGAVLTFHDITERRRLERIRRDFVANASHELRTPLTSVRGFVEALEDGAIAEPATAERFLGKIRTHADRMAALVEDLLELSRLESGERPPLWEEVPPAEIAQDVAASFAGPAARNRIHLTHVDSGAPPVVTDADRLRRIVENLVDNAVKYTPEGGHVTIGTAPAPSGGAVLEVRDDGPGIAPEHLPRIFERFYRVDKARSRELGGTGLGLAIVKHLAEGMGATVTVASEVGKGTTVSVTVPPGRQNLHAS